MMWVLPDMTDVIGCCALASLRYATLTQGAFTKNPDLVETPPPSPRTEKAFASKEQVEQLL